jgi:hypothetical protein
MEHISIYPSRTTVPEMEDDFTPLVAKGLTYQVGEAIRHARYRSDTGTNLPLVPEASLRGVVEQYQDFYLAALQSIAGTHLVKPPEDKPLPVRYTWAPPMQYGFAVTVGRMYEGSAVAARRTNRLRKYGLITTKGHSRTYEVNFLAVHPHVAEAFVIGLRHAATLCEVEFPYTLLNSYIEASHRSAEAKCAELGATLHDKLYPGVF